VTQNVWLVEHPYLCLVAEFHAQVDKAVASLPTSLASVPNWQEYVRDFRAGVPLLQSSTFTIDLKLVEIFVESLVGRLVSTRLPEMLTQEVQDLDAELRHDPHAVHRIVVWLLDQDVSPCGRCGLLRYLAWTVMARYLSNVVDAFGKWREEDHWLRRYCPMCGSPPAMAQLVGIDPGRSRLLCCGCCRTRWRYRRTGCPFCENEDDHRLAALAVEGEQGLRIDYCEFCKGYIKTYDGSGNESILLADWTSLHLDVIAHDHGLKRLAASLYEL
jgi:FdhE protein